MNEEPRVPAAELRTFACEALLAVGMPLEDASIAADAMLWGELRGLTAHGVSGKLPQCVGRIQAGGTNATAQLTSVVDRGPIRVLDAHAAWGQVAGVRGMRMAMELARSVGIGLVTIRESSSAAAMGHYVDTAARAGLIAFAFTNGSSIIAPWGGARRLLGNQAHAIGCPSRRFAPIVYDSAVTRMSTGEIDALHEQGRPLPEGVLFDSTGQPTLDPSAWVDGMLVPSGGHRGYGLAVMLEVLTGVLSGGEVYAPDVRQPGDLAGKQGISLFLMAIDPASMMPLDAFLARADALIDRIHATPRAEGVDRIYYPGERSAELAAERQANGVPMPRARLARLEALGDRLGIAFRA
jgi:LDH2 family malate/lactate/ureidoglycolate dehydrogenase